MTDEELLKITNSIEEKLGKENSAVIADDIGLLMTGNATAQKTLQERESEVSGLKARHEKLVLAIVVVLTRKVKIILKKVILIYLMLLINQVDSHVN